MFDAAALRQPVRSHFPDREKPEIPSRGKQHGSAIRRPAIVVERSVQDRAVREKRGRRGHERLSTGNGVLDPELYGGAVSGQVRE